MPTEIDADGIAVLPWPHLDGDAIAALGAALDPLLANKAIRGVVLTGLGAGLDLAWVHHVAGTPSLSNAIAEFRRILGRIADAVCPFVAAIGGDALGAGLEAALACNYLIVADRPGVRLGFPEIRYALPPAGGSSQRLADRIGADAAHSLLLDGRLLTATEARAAGLIDDIRPPGELMAAARRLIAQPPPLAPYGTDPFAQRTRSMAAARASVLRSAANPDDFAQAATNDITRAMLRTEVVNLRRANDLSARPVGFAPYPLRRIGVLGAGLMGGGIALVAARAGLDVVLLDVDLATAQRGRDRLRRQAEQWHAADELLARIEPTDTFDRLAGADLIVEAVFEDRAIKAAATRRAEAVLGPDAIFATNTSTLPITGLAEASSRPDRFIGLHFFSPVPRMPLLEIIRGRLTSDRTLAASMDFAKRIGKTPIVVNDSRGFYTSRVIMTYQAEAFAMLAEGVAPDRIEAAGAAAGMPLPPLALADAVGLDLIHQINLQTAADLGTSEPSTAERAVAKMVEKHRRSGKKSGQGFYDYAPDGKRLWPELAALFPSTPVQPPPEELRDRLLARQALEAAKCLEERVVTEPAHADIGAVLGWNFTPWTGGPLSYIDLVGTARFVHDCDSLADRLGERFRPNPLLRRLAREGLSVYGAAEHMTG